jgi:chromosome segregation ATPase
VIGFWIAVAVLVLCLGAGLGIAVTRGLQAWRQLKRTRVTLRQELARVMDATSEIERQLAAASAGQARLQEAVRRLSASRADLMTQLAAVTEARWLLRRLFPFLPR